MWNRFDPARGLSFSTYAYRTLKLRVVDWYRHEFGDSRYGQRPQVLSLDGPAPRGESSHATLGDFVGETLDDHDELIDVDVLRELAGDGELSAEASQILREVALPLALGLTKDEVAERLGRSRRHVNRCLDELRVEYRALEERRRMPQKPKKKSPPKVVPTHVASRPQAPCCDSCLNETIKQLEKSGLSRPEARIEAGKRTRMVWIDVGKSAICRACHPDVVPNRDTRRANGWRPTTTRAPRPLSEEQRARLEEQASSDERRRQDRTVRRATTRLERIAKEARQ